MLLTEKVKVTLRNQSDRDYYKSKGYEVDKEKKIEVSVWDLPENSSKKVQIQCDYCKEKSKIVDVFKTLNMETIIRSSSSAISDEIDLIRFHYKDDVYFDYCISNCNLKDIKEEFRGKIREENKIDDHWVSVYDEIPSI